MTQKEQRPDQMMDESQLHAEMSELKQDMRSAKITHWIQKNQQMLMTVTVLLVMAMFAGGMWSEHKKTQMESAAMMYYQGISSQDKAQQQALLEQVIRDYAETTYATLSHMRLATLVDTEQHLHAVIDHSQEAELRWQATLDLAEYLMSQGKNDDVKSLLKDHMGQQFEQPRYSLLANISNGNEKKEYLQKAVDAVSNDKVLKEKLEAQLAQLQQH